MVPERLEETEELQERPSVLVATSSLLLLGMVAINLLFAQRIAEPPQFMLLLLLFTKRKRGVHVPEAPLGLVKTFLLPRAANMPPP